MKTAKPPPPAAAATAAADTPSGRRQPVRQTRTHGSRTIAGAGRGAAPRDTGAPATLAREQPADIFPGITHFADTITALPKELVRHFTLLKEVDAKIHAPQQALFVAAEKTLNLSTYDRPRPDLDAVGSTPGSSAAVTNHNSPNGVASYSSQADAESLERRKLWRETGLKIQEILLSMDEKNHVISTAVDALNKQLNRIDSVWPHLMQEFSDEAKWGSSNHWAYPENRMDKAGRALNNAQAERSRREGAASLSAAAQQIAEEAAARSDARKQAVAAKKERNNRAQAAHDSDGDDNDPKARPESTRKPAAGGKNRKPAASASADAQQAVGLGTANASPATGTPATKRRKVEKTNNASGGAPMERASSNVAGNSAAKPKTSSPHETPAPEGQGKKRKALPTTGNQSKKRNGITNSPSVASSPVITAFPEPAVKAARNSPVPIPAPPARTPAMSRAKTTPQNNSENGRQRPSSSASNKPNGIATTPVEHGPHTNGVRASTEPKPAREALLAATPVAKTESQKMEDVVVESTTVIPTPIIPPPPPLKKEPLTATKASNDGPRQGSKESTPSANGSHATAQTPLPPPPPPVAAAAAAPAAAPAASTAIAGSTTPTAPSPAVAPAQTPVAVTTTSGLGITSVTVTTKSGRASKPSTPALGSFPDNVRARPSRASGATTSTGKRSHKKGAAAAAKASAAAQASVKVGGDAAGGVKDEGDDDEDEVEITYCYCGQPSYGEMIACDNRDCTYEWFHLPCVGLKAAPKGSVKWYCKYCKKKMGIPEDEHNGV